MRALVAFILDLLAERARGRKPAVHVVVLPLPLPPKPPAEERPN